MIGGKKNKVAGSWNEFVMKIKKEEGLASLKEAMKRASKRKAEWKRGAKGGEPMDEVQEAPMMEENVEETVMEEAPMMEEDVVEEEPMAGGKKRNVSQFAFGGARRSRKARRSRASRRGRSMGAAMAGGRRRSRRRSASLARAQGRSRASRRAMGLALAQR